MNAQDKYVAKHVARAHRHQQGFSQAARGNDGIIKEFGYPPASATKKQPDSELYAQKHP